MLLGGDSFEAISQLDALGPTEIGFFLRGAPLRGTFQVAK
jgi:hypothetical protein